MVGRIFRTVECFNYTNTPQIEIVLISVDGKRLPEKAVELVARLTTVYHDAERASKIQKTKTHNKNSSSTLNKHEVSKFKI
ncbi:MAG: hypothetical protein ACTSUQ_06900 [Candidatus Freyarchaeota archaeon]